MKRWPAISHSIFERQKMLILRRKKNESIIIGTQENSPEVEITVVAIKDDDNVRIGITLPKDWIVRRAETFAAIQEEMHRNDRNEVTLEVPGAIMAHVVAGLVEKQLSFSASSVPTKFFLGDPVWTVTLRPCDKPLE